MVVRQRRVARDGALFSNKKKDFKFTQGRHSRLSHIAMWNPILPIPLAGGVPILAVRNLGELGLI